MAIAVKAKLGSNVFEEHGDPESVKTMAQAGGDTGK